MTSYLTKIETIKNITPALLTSSRLFMGILLFFTIKIGLNSTSILLFVTAILTDILDGALARRFHVESKFGEYLDAIADGWLVAWVWYGLWDLVT